MTGAPPDLVLDTTCLSHFARIDRLWLSLIPSDEWEHLVSFGKWAQRIGTTERNVGEATVFAAAEVLSAIAIVDDRSATQVARKYGLEVHGTLWLPAKACHADELTQAAASTLVDMLRGSGMRLPCSGTDFPAYARKHGIL